MDRENGRLIAVGDIHGCALAFHAILNAIKPTDHDTVVLLGDYVDRGPETREVLDLALQLTRVCRVVPLLGNHELMMLMAYADHSQAFAWLQCGGQATLDSYGGSPADVPAAHLDFLHSCVPYYETERHIFVHANYEPHLRLRDQPESHLFWLHLHMYRPEPHMSGKTAIVGHTPQKSGEILNLGHLICLDTYCVGGGWLTAMDVEEGTYWQADHRGRLRATT